MSPCALDAIKSAPIASTSHLIFIRQVLRLLQNSQACLHTSPPAKLMAVTVWLRWRAFSFRISHFAFSVPLLMPYLGPALDVPRFFADLTPAAKGAGFTIEPYGEA